MTAITVTIPEEMDKKIAHLKVEKHIGSKSEMIVRIIDEYFEAKKKEFEKLEKETGHGNWM
jgi:metal-responsive CopG/Arc/MetJ family transcriptional regulator